MQQDQEGMQFVVCITHNVLMLLLLVGISMKLEIGRA